MVSQQTASCSGRDSSRGFAAPVLLPSVEYQEASDVKRILVVDDEKQITGMLQQAFGRSGYQVVKAAGTEQAMSCFRSHPTDLVITDLFMPQRGGLDLIRQLTDETPGIKIIAITGVAVQDVADLESLATQAGARHVFRKPLDLDELLAAVDELLDSVP